MLSTLGGTVISAVGFRARHEKTATSQSLNTARLGGSAGYGGVSGSARTSGGGSSLGSSGGRLRDNLGGSSTSLGSSLGGSGNSSCGSCARLGDGLREGLSRGSSLCSVGVGSSRSLGSGLGGLGTSDSVGGLSSGFSLRGSLSGLSTGSLGTDGLGAGSSLSARSSAGFLSTGEAKLKVVELARLSAIISNPIKLLDESVVECASTALDGERLAAKSHAASVTTLGPVYTSRGSTDDLVIAVGSNALLAACSGRLLEGSVLRASSHSGGGSRRLSGSSTGLGSGGKSSDSTRGGDTRQG